jgi:hypothetical protein
MDVCLTCAVFNESINERMNDCILCSDCLIFKYIVDFISKSKHKIYFRSKETFKYYIGEFLALKRNVIKNVKDENIKNNFLFKLEYCSSFVNDSCELLIKVYKEFEDKIEKINKEFYRIQIKFLYSIILKNVACLIKLYECNSFLTSFPNDKMHESLTFNLFENNQNHALKKIIDSKEKLNVIFYHLNNCDLFFETNDYAEKKISY